MKPSALLAEHIERVKGVIARYPVRNPRLFGSAARGDEQRDSDIDILVDPELHTTLYDLAELEIELENVLGCKVDVRTPGDLAPEVAARVATDLRPM